MPDAQVVEWIREKYTAIISDLDERARRRWGAAEARSLGWGGIQAVAAATGLSDRTIRNGIKELDDPDAPPANQQRRSGGGRKRRESEQPQLVESLQLLVDSGTRGDPMSPLRWTCKSTRTSSFLTVLNQAGQPTSLPATDPTGGWETEAALDVEWAQALAPGAQIIVVEANSQSLGDLMAAVATAANQPGVSVVSMSWGFAEGQAVFQADEALYDGVFTTPAGHQPVTFVASTGD